MGSHPNISADTFPKQGNYLNKRARVLFHYAEPEVKGTIVRDDVEDPYQTIIRLDDNRYILSTECQFSPDGD